jgi:hypothetical protein
LTTRFVVLAFAAYGTKALYEDYVEPLRQPSRDFIEHARAALSGTAERVTEATGDLNDEMRTAARTAAHEAANNIAETEQRRVLEPAGRWGD